MDLTIGATGAFIQLLLLELHGYLQWEGLAIFIGLLGAYCLRLYRPIATGFISLSHRLRKPEVIGFVSLIDHYDVQFKVVGIGPLTPPTPTSTAPFLSTVDAP
jgi:hypothetical protein